MKKCIFCDNPANSNEHVIPQWILRASEPTSGGVFPVDIARFQDGKGIFDERSHPSLNFKSRIVCESCNNGWMAKMEAEVKPILGPLMERSFPVLEKSFFEFLTPNRELLTRWALKTVLMISHALPGDPIILSEKMINSISQGTTPRRVWLDVAKATNNGIGALLSPTFLVRNGHLPAKITKSIFKDCFQLCLQVNRFLLRIGRSPKADVLYLNIHGMHPFRVFPYPDTRLPKMYENKDLFNLSQSVMLDTGEGCRGDKVGLFSPSEADLKILMQNYHFRTQNDNR